MHISANLTGREYWNIWENNMTEMLDALAARVHVPIIASGGAGKMGDFADLFTHPGMDAGLAASIFHTRQVEIRALKAFLHSRGVSVRL